jgi:hypothetical protein
VQTDPLFRLEEQLHVFAGQVVLVGIADHEEVYFGAGGDILVDVYEFVARDAAALFFGFGCCDFLNVAE